MTNEKKQEELFLKIKKTQKKLDKLKKELMDLQIDDLLNSYDNGTIISIKNPVTFFGIKNFNKL